MRLKIIKSHFKPLYQYDSECMIAYSRGYIHLYSVIKGKSVKKIKMPSCIGMGVFGTFRITERLLRLEPRGIVKLDNMKYSLCFHGKIYEIDFNSETIRLEHTFRKGMNHPLYMEKVSGLSDWNDCVMYGEYMGNSDLGPVAIYRKLLNRLDMHWEKCYEFPCGTINHIHNIIKDPFRQGVLLLTGDTDGGSGIWLARNDFKEVVPLLVGSQIYRACAAIPLEHGILYATDTPLRKNGIYYAFCKKGRWKAKKICDMPGPCVYYTSNSEKAIFSTTVEADSNLKGMRYLLSMHRGKGVSDHYTHLIEADFQGNVKEIGKIKKDFWPMGLFQFGALIFAEESFSSYGRIYFYGTALKRYDGKWLELEGKHQMLNKFG